MVDTQPRVVHLEATVCIALGALAATVALYGAGAWRWVIIPAVIWLMAGLWLFVSATSWEQRSYRYRHRVIVTAHVVTVIPWLLLIAAGGPTSDDPGAMLVDDDREDEQTDAH